DGRGAGRRRGPTGAAGAAGAAADGLVLGARPVLAALRAAARFRCPQTPSAGVSALALSLPPCRTVGGFSGLFGDSGGAARALTQVVELRPAHRTAGDDLDAVDAR